MLELIKNKVNLDESLVYRGRWVNLTFILGLGEEDYLIKVVEGKVQSVILRALATDTGIFSIRAKKSTWEEYWASSPKRDYHDICSMLPKKLVKIDGDLLPFMQNLQYFKDVIAALRVK